MMQPTQETDRIILMQIQERIQRIRDYTKESRAVFNSSRMIQDAVEFNLQGLGALARRLSPHMVNDEAGLSWRVLDNIHQLLVVDYLKTTPDAVWKVIENDLPGIATTVDRMERRLSQSNFE